MKIGLVGLGLICLALAAQRANAGPYLDDEEQNALAAASEDDYSDNAIDNLLHAVQQKRACVPRNGICDHRPNDCCFSSSCRCNLWGSNCRCQRVGLFQKWG
ncbi:toxin Tbo-IT2-like isoform X2 [Phymastichus coffea]|uniref:toxin Tbo-IT2-like isoform X2 n=1 Tax=Phymastichus coffea TaxID=108790 RepID=UPI00273C6B9E|nr:toxin Tbo-IT2-like isoform X2 [Phymastichus coffea]